MPYPPLGHRFSRSGATARESGFYQRGGPWLVRCFGLKVTAATSFGPPLCGLAVRKIGAMSFDAVTLFKEVMDPGTAETLASICRPQGLCRAIDIAMVDDSMATELLQGLDGELREPLTKAVALARPLVRGWATSFRLKEGGVVGGGSGGGFCGFPAPPPVRPLFRRSPCTFFCAGYPLGTVRCTGRGAYFGSALLPAALGFHQEDS